MRISSPLFPRIKSAFLDPLKLSSLFEPATVSPVVGGSKLLGFDASSVVEDDSDSTGVSIRSLTMRKNDLSKPRPQNLLFAI